MGDETYDAKELCTPRTWLNPSSAIPRSFEDSRSVDDLKCSSSGPRWICSLLFRMFIRATVAHENEDVFGNG